ncbi:MAG: hypothetical protein ACE5HH_03010 [Candidatus Hydrothermarchaeales archaeon]
MKPKGFIALVVVFIVIGCTVGTTHTIRLRGNVNPAQISLDKKMPVSIEASVENIGNATHTISVDVVDTEGLAVEKPERTSFTLQPGESRVVTFIGRLEEAAVPGKYRVEIIAETQAGDQISETVYLRVVAERGFI